jgi:hypothetical protein
MDPSGNADSNAFSSSEMQQIRPRKMSQDLM